MRDELLAEEGPLRWARTPIAWESYEIVDHGHAAQLFFIHTALNAPLSDVILTEDPHSITIRLFERALVGVFPDDTVAASTLAAVTNCIEISLPSEIGQRSLIDGATNRRARPLSQPRESEADDLAGFRATRDRGCPRWIP
jgi:hypothetical protein